MELRDYYIILYDYYGNLLSDKQQKYFEYYYFDNFSLQEIGDSLEVSRNAVHKTLMMVEDKLNFYEKKLQLYEKNKKLQLVLEGVNEDLKKKILDVFS